MFWFKMFLTCTEKKFASDFGEMEIVVEHENVWKRVKTDQVIHGNLV